MVLANIRTRFADAFFPRLLEWQAAVMMFVGGVLMLTNPRLMELSPIGYERMLDVMAQLHWGYLAFLIGTVRLVVLIINGAWRHSPHARAVAAFLSCAIWFPLALSFSAIAGWGMVFATGMLFGDLLNIVRTMRDARVVDDEYSRRAQNAR